MLCGSLHELGRGWILFLRTVCGCDRWFQGTTHFILVLFVCRAALFVHLSGKGHLESKSPPEVGPYAVAVNEPE